MHNLFVSSEDEFLIFAYNKLKLSRPFFLNNNLKFVSNKKNPSNNLKSVMKKHIFSVLSMEIILQLSTWRAQNYSFGRIEIILSTIFTNTFHNTAVTCAW